MSICHGLLRFYGDQKIHSGVKIGNAFVINQNSKRGLVAPGPKYPRKLLLPFLEYIFVNRREWYVYILANQSRSTIYIGITNDLERRIYEHREGLCKGFTQKYKAKFLMYYESFDDPLSAIHREKELKSWARKKKNLLIEENNPSWRDLAADWQI